MAQSGNQRDSNLNKNMATYHYDCVGIMFAITSNGEMKYLTPEELEEQRINNLNPRSKGLTGRLLTQDEMDDRNGRPDERE